jgi:hypothetical protein
MPSSNYRLFEQAMRGRKPICCEYEGYPRELCPIVLGHSQRQEKVLTYQFGGQSNRVCRAKVNGAVYGLQKSALLNFVTGLGELAPAIPSHKAASRSSTSM